MTLSVRFFLHPVALALVLTAFADICFSLALITPAFANIGSAFALIAPALAHLGPTCASVTLALFLQSLAFILQLFTLGDFTLAL